MIRVYRVMNDVDRYQYVLPQDSTDWAKLEMDCTPKAAGWVPPPVYVFKPLHRSGDFYQFSTAALITSPRATEALRDHLEMAGELLPLPLDGRELTLLNVTLCTNSLDHDRTGWSRNPLTGERVRPERYVFHPDRFAESTLFKIPETRRAEVLVVEGVTADEEFRETVERAGLQGLVFTELWRSAA